MSEVLSIEQLRQMAQPVIEIPDFESKGTIKIRVQKPRLMTMVVQGKIPNHLMSKVNEMITGKSSKKEKEEMQVTDIAQMMEIYCQSCMVEPTYDEFKEIMTDEQMEAVFNWAMGTVNKIDSFRTDEGNGTSDNNGKTLPKKTK